jgi:hypothetical protein
MNSIIAQLDKRVFLGGFNIEAEVANLIGKVPTISEEYAYHVLRLVEAIKNSERMFYIGPVPHPLGQWHDFAKVQTIELSEQCFRLKEWSQYLAMQFPDLGEKTALEAISRYVYLYHLR